MSDSLADVRRKLVMVHAAGALGIVVLTMVAYFGVANPMLERRAETDRLAAEVAEQSAELDKLAKARHLMSSQLAAGQKQLASSDVKLLTPENLNARLAAIADLAGQCGLQVENLNPETVRADSNVLAYPVKITGRGTYRTCHAFIRALRTTLPDTSVQNLAMSADAGANHPAATFDMTLLWIARKEPERTASVNP